MFLSITNFYENFENGGVKLVLIDKSEILSLIGEFPITRWRKRFVI